MGGIWVSKQRARKKSAGDWLLAWTQRDLTERNSALSAWFGDKQNDILHFPSTSHDSQFTSQIYSLLSHRVLFLWPNESSLYWQIGHVFTVTPKSYHLIQSTTSPQTQRLVKKIEFRQRRRLHFPNTRTPVPLHRHIRLQNPHIPRHKKKMCQVTHC